MRSRRFLLKWLSCGGGAALLLAACGESGSNLSAVVPDETSLLGSDVSPQAVTFPQAVASGDPSATGAVVWTRVLPQGRSRSFPVELEVSPQDNFSTSVQRFTLTANERAGSNYRLAPGDYVVRQQLTGLLPNQQYFYRFLAMGSSSPVGRFRTLPEGSAGAIRFLHMSCANEPPYPISGALGQEIERFNPNFVVFNGDTVYADAFWQGGDPEPRLDFYRGLYRQQRDPNYTGAGFPDLYINLPFIANWDDHEVIDDYAGRGPRRAVQPDRRSVENLQRFGYQSFFEYTPMRIQFEDNPAGVDPQTRLFRTTKVGTDAELFTLDLRQYRDEQGGVLGLVPLFPTIPAGVTRDEVIAIIEDFTGLTVTPLLEKGFLGGPQYEEIYKRTPRTIMGSAQKNWFKQKLLASRATFKIIVSELIMSENYALSQDRWEGYNLERLEIINFIESNNIRNVVVISGDQHAGQISLVNPRPDGRLPDNPIWEIGTGPTGQSTLAGSVDDIGASLSIENASELYYLLLNYFSAAPEFGGKPGVSRSDLLFYEIDTPNYTAIEISGGRLIAEIRNGSGAVIRDPKNRLGRIEITAS